MKPRHEWKHEITAADRLVLSARLSAVARRDRHGQNGRYEIRSLYFDDLRDTALREKLDGVAKREKFRIRYYGGDISYICLEKKSKRDGPSFSASRRCRTFWRALWIGCRRAGGPWSRSSIGR